MTLAVAIIASTVLICGTVAWVTRSRDGRIRRARRRRIRRHQGYLLWWLPIGRDRW
jgi:hypothetical protein